MKHMPGWMIALAISGSAAHAQAPAPTAPLAGLSFLIGEWAHGKGKVTDKGDTSTGSSTFTNEVGGTVILRRDHTALFGATGRPVGAFDQIMMIYAEGGAVHADYSDGTHVIHYVSSRIVPGKSIDFASAAGPEIPTFRLHYELANSTTLAVDFGMAPPGSTDFHPIATGTLSRKP